MGCGADMTQMVPTKYHYKEVRSTCGQTSIHGTELLCDECMPGDAVIYRRYSRLDDDYEGITITYNIELAAATSLEVAQKAIRNLLRQSCYCEYDCCGCWNGWGSIVKRIGERTYLCKGHYAPNY